MKIEVVKTTAHIKLFHKVTEIIYKNDPHWVPYLFNDVEAVFDPKKNKLFSEGGEAERWLFYDDANNLIGRIAVFVNPKTVNVSRFKTGGLGFFECINDKKAAHFLFDKAVEWLKERGMEAVDGPINFGDRDRFWGCQITNFDEHAIYPMNYNPPYYQELFESYGFGVYFEQYMYWRNMTDEAQPIFFRKYNQLKGDPDFQVRNVRDLSIKQLAENFRVVYNSAWGGHEHFKELTYEGAQKIFKTTKPAIDKDIIMFCYYKGQPIGFYMNMPELNQIFKYVNGKLDLIGKLKFLYHKWKKTPTRMTGMLFGIVKEWQGKGIEAAMIVHASQTLRPLGIYKDTVLTWVGDFNPKMLKMVSNLSPTLWRKHYTYRYQFDRNEPFERCPMMD